MDTLFSIDDRMKSLGWRDFPFRIDIIPEIFAGQQRILSPLIMQLRTGNIVLIEGGRGTGKTHILQWLSQHIHNSLDMIPCSISEPLNSQILLARMRSVLHQVTGENSSSSLDLIDNLSDRLKRFYRERHHRIVLLLDEGEALAFREGDSVQVETEKRKTIRWLRIMSDLPAVVVFLAGLTSFRKALTSVFPPFSDRITYKLQLERESEHGREVLTRDETEAMLQQRIEFVGGSGITPFTPEAIDAIYLHTHGYPRATLRFCKNILSLAFQDDTPAGDRITYDFVQHVMRQKPSPPPDFALVPTTTDASHFFEGSSEEERWFIEFDELSAIQRDILNLVKEQRKVTSSIVAEELGIAKGTASNELKKLFDMKKLQRRKSYRGFEYLPN